MAKGEIQPAAQGESFQSKIPVDELVPLNEEEPLLNSPIKGSSSLQYQLSLPATAASSL